MNQSGGWSKQIKSLQQTALQNTAVKSLGFWIADYDQGAKHWYEQAYPLGPSGMLSGFVSGKQHPDLNVDLTPVAVEGAGASVYKVSISVVPSPNLQYTMRFATSSQKSVAKSWGLVVGTMASPTVTR